jgi:hypothetical protein
MRVEHSTLSLLATCNSCVLGCSQRHMAHEGLDGSSASHPPLCKHHVTGEETLPAGVVTDGNLFCFHVKGG